jgi:hypothetical protein
MPGVALFDTCNVQSSVFRGCPVLPLSASSTGRPEKCLTMSCLSTRQPVGLLETSSSSLLQTRFNRTDCPYHPVTPTKKAGLSSEALGQATTPFLQQSLVPTPTLTPRNRNRNQTLNRQKDGIPSTNHSPLPFSPSNTCTRVSCGSQRGHSRLGR